MESIQVKKGDVLYLALEDTPRRIQRRIRELGFNNPEELAGLDIMFEIPRQDQGGLDVIRAWLEEHPDARLVVIDTLSRFRTLKTKAAEIYQADNDTVAEIKKIADEHRVAMVIVHHTKKAKEADFINDASGSTGLTGAADSILALQRKRGENAAMLLITGRDVEELTLAFTVNGVQWELKGDAAQVMIREEEQAILDYLEENGESSPKDIHKAVGGNSSTIKSRLTYMRNKALIRKTKRGAYSLPLVSKNHAESS